MPQPIEKKDRPDTRAEASTRMLKDANTVRDVASGTSRMREQGTTYLPKNPAETDRDYNNRLSASVVTGATGRTIGGLAGLVLRESIGLGDDVPGPIVQLAEDIDNRGSHLDVFAKDVFEDALTVGHAGILVDMPLVPDAQRLTRQAETSMGVRPYLVCYRKENMISWRFVRERGRQVLQQLVLYEPTVEPDGKYGEEKVDRWRVLMRSPDGVVSWALVRKVDDEYVQEGTGTIENVREIPFVVVYGGARTAELESDPPLLALAHTEIAHYRVLSDLLQSMSKANNPMLVGRGIDTDDEIEVGANTMFTLPHTEQVIEYVEHTGAAHASTEKRLEDFKHDMSVLGMAMLFPETRAPETATARRMDKTEQDSKLATAARSLQDTLENAFSFMAQMMRLGDDGGSVVVNRDFDVLTIDSQQLTAWLAARSAGEITQETFWQILLEGGALPDDFDPDRERAALEAEVPPAMPDPAPEPDDEGMEDAA